MNGSQPLHPNLARIAAEYDRVMYRFSVNQIDAATAKAQLAVLQARDDEGVVWMLNPDTGEWQYRTRAGKWVLAEPPSSGVATLTAHDLSRDPTKFNPDSKIHFEEAEVERHGLHGAVKGKVVTPGQQTSSPLLKRILLVLVLVVLIVVGVGALGGDQEGQPAEGGAPTLPQDTPTVQQDMPSG